jgi:hypothetical protein
MEKKMKFKSIKEMEIELRKVRSLKMLKEDITFISQGKSITVKFIGCGASGGVQETAYLGFETSDTIKVRFSGTGDDIVVEDIKLFRAL